MKTIKPQTYQDLADKLIAAIGSREYFNGQVDSEEYLLRMTVVAYRSDEGAITGIVPVWWEFTWIENPDPFATDFSWSEFRKYLPNNH